MIINIAKHDLISNVVYVKGQCSDNRLNRKVKVIYLLCEKWQLTHILLGVIKSRPSLKYILINILQ